MTLLTHIRKAIEAIDPTYCDLSKLTYSTTVSASEAKKYLERPFAYEFYHQLRMRMTPNWTAQLQGEVDKRYQGIRRIPDFLIHRPNRTDCNLAAVEFKLAERRWEILADDLGKLARFKLPPLSYELLVEVVIGDSDSLPSLQKEVGNFVTSTGKPLTILWYNVATRTVNREDVRVQPSMSRSPRKGGPAS